MSLPDHRLLVVETELVSTFKVASRDGNTLSPVIRQAWDTGTLRTMTRNSPLTATDAHISLIGHITAEELHRHLTSTEMANGFANRFLWLSVPLEAASRWRQPRPAGADTARSARPGCALVRAPHRTCRPRPRRTHPLARRVRRPLRRRTGLVGSLLARAEAQVTRLAMLYALLDHSDVVREPHLRAALELWGYADRSVRHLFGSATGNPDADLIQRHAAEHGNGGITRTQISSLFSRNASADRIDRAIQQLVTNGTATLERETTGGRPSERLFSLISLFSYFNDWPSPPSTNAYHGLLGEIVRTVEPHTERQTP